MVPFFILVKLLQQGRACSHLELVGLIQEVTTPAAHMYVAQQATVCGAQESMAGYCLVLELQLHSVMPML